MLIIEWQATGRLGGQAMTLIVINLVVQLHVLGGISWGGHVGGLIGGILITLAYAHWGRGKSAYGQLGLGGALGLIVVAAGSIALAYWKVRGLRVANRDGVFHHLVHLGISPWEKAVRTALVYAAILGLLHLAGKRALAPAELVRPRRAAPALERRPERDHRPGRLARSAACSARRS